MLEKLNFLGRAVPAEKLISMRKSAESLDDAKMLPGELLQEFISGPLLGQTDAGLLIFFVFTVHQRHV